MYTWGYIKESALANLNMTTKEAVENGLINKFHYWANEVITQVSSAVKPKRTFADFTIEEDDTFIEKTMPDDFVSFGSDLSLIYKVNEYGELECEECSDDDFIYRGYNKILFLREGKFNVSYNARWFTFNSTLPDNTELDIPADIVECIPSYIAMKGYKTIDEYKSTVFKNEYEVQLARIDDSHYETNTSFKIGGGW